MRGLAIWNAHTTNVFISPYAIQILDNIPVGKHVKKAEISQPDIISSDIYTPS